MISETQPIAATPAEVWGVISTPRYLEDCHPFCETNPVQQWPGEGSEDTIKYYGGRVVHRHFTSWMDGVGYDIDTTDRRGRPQAGVRWRIAPAGDHAELTIELEPTFRLPRPQRWVAPLIVRYQMRRYLRSVLLGIAHRVETGTPVARNQFGSHRWFSP